MAPFNCRKTSQAALLMSIAAAFPLVSHGAPAARVDFASGNVTAVTASGQTRPLLKGAQLEQGETIATNTGRAQLRFTDGAYVSLQPQSEFRIDQYRFAGKVDGNEKSVFSLIKGGLRTITGLVGRSNNKNYQINTSVATIGIRGTEYTIQYGQSITGTVGEGEIEVCNGAGCLNVTNGESYYVLNQDVKPELTNKGTDLPPAPPESPPQKFAENENVDESGDLCTLFPEQCQIQPTGILTGTITANVAIVWNCDGACTYSQQTSATLDSAGVLTTFGSGSPQTLSSPSSSGNDGIIAWGSAPDSSGGVLSSFGGTGILHYVVGTPVPDIGSIASQIGSYTFLGGSIPTDISGNTVGLTLTDASMSADFLNGLVSGSLSWSNNLSASFSGGLTGESFSGSGLTDVSGSVFVDGFFAGDKAARAGLVYEVNDLVALPNVGTVIGSATLTQTSLTTSTAFAQ